MQVDDALLPSSQAVLSIARPSHQLWIDSYSVAPRHDTVSACLQGVWERDPVRKDDSFVSFEEVMAKALEMEVDMVLLGGDLFHDNKPSRATVRRIDMGHIATSHTSW